MFSIALVNEILIGYGIDIEANVASREMLTLRHYGKLVGAYTKIEHGIRLLAISGQRRFINLNLSDPQFIEKVRAFVHDLGLPESGCDPYLSYSDVPKPDL